MAGGSTRAVYAAIGGNTLVMIAKFIAFGVTGSGAMLSEGIHSLADVGNQCLLALGIRASARTADEEHPYGYAREQFVWALISAVGIFFLGCGVTVYHGVHSLLHPEPLEALGVAMGVLLLSLVIEGGTLVVAARAVLQQAKASGMGLREYVVSGPDPMGVAVLLEDGAAVLGVLMAMLAIGLAQLTGDPIWDGIASIAIGLLLGAIAIFLIYKNRSSLLTPSVRPELRDRAVALLETDPVVESVKDVKATVIGADSVRFKAEVEFDGREVTRRYLEGQDLQAALERLGTVEDLRAYLLELGDGLLDALGDEVDRLEEEIQRAVPKTRHVDLEAD